MRPRYRMLAPIAAMACATGCAAPPVAPPTIASQGAATLEHLPAIRSDYFRLDSRTLGRPFHIYVRLPDSYRDAPARAYPAVYLLDGDSLFPILAAGHLFLGYDEQIPEALIVGIAYGSFDPAVNRRDLDFTAPGQKARQGEGGAGAFQAFLKDELLPRIDRLYRTRPDRRILFGQSRGGSFVLYSAFTDPDLFWGRIASNPALEPGRELFFGKPARGRRSDLSLIVASGSRDRPVLREAALAWFAYWAGRSDRPWALRTVTIEGGTHAANSADAYRHGMLTLFPRPPGT